MLQTSTNPLEFVSFFQPLNFTCFFCIIAFHEHIVQLQKNYKMFVDDGDSGTYIADYLYQEDVLNTEEKEEITNSSLTRQESNRILCDKFFRKGKDAYRHLIKALRHGKCFELASNMEETKVSEHEIQLCKKGINSEFIYYFKYEILLLRIIEIY